MDQIMHLVGTDQGNLTLLGKILLISLIIVLAKVVLYFLERLFHHRLAQNYIEGASDVKIKTLASIFKNFLRVLIYFLAITQILNLFGVNTASIIAIAGVGGVAIAFAAQSLVKDIIMGAFILFENLYNIGDDVVIDGQFGTVSFIGLRTTQLVNYDGHRITVPHSQETTVINYSKANILAKADFPVDFDLPFEVLQERLRQMLEEIQREEQCFTVEPKVFGITKMTDFHYWVEVRGKVRYQDQIRIQTMMRSRALAILQEMKKEGKRNE